MENVWLVVITLLTLVALVYTHLRLPWHTPGRRQLRTARIVLLATGVAFGWVMARIYGMATDLNPVLVFISGLGLVHVPAAFILLIKRQRPGE